MRIYKNSKLTHKWLHHINKNLKLYNMRLAKISPILTGLLFVGAMINPVSAVSEATTPIVGILQVDALGNSDTYISIPLQQTAVFNGAVSSATGSVLTVEGTPGWTDDEFAADTAYFLFVRDADVSGVAGNYVTITGNTASTLTLDSDDLTELTSGDAISIHPYWTLSTVFPDGDGVHEASNFASLDSEVLFPSLDEAGTQKAAGYSYFYYEGNWHRQGDAELTETFNNEIILPDSYIILRHNISTDTKVTFTGGVIMGELSSTLLSHNISGEDNVIGLQRPILMDLVESGLAATITATTDTGDIKDVVMIFDFSTPLKNRMVASASAEASVKQYFYMSGAWRLVSNPESPLTGNDIPNLTPGMGFVVRRAQAAGVNEDDWSNSANYSN